MNHYEVLGVEVNASEGTIRSAFRRLARRYHPDAGEGSSSERFREIADAYETLTNPVRRQAYDRSLLAVAVPVRVVRRAEPTRQGWGSAPEPLRAEDQFAYRSAFEALFEHLFREFQDDWLFDWPFGR
jgi:curved DNA-binding protein